MANREGRINEALGRLGDAYRAGLIAIEEYRDRRRQLVDGWDDKDITTSPGMAAWTDATMTKAALTHTVVRQPAAPVAVASAPAAAERSPPLRWPLILIGLALAALLVIALALAPSRTPPQPPAPAAATGSPGAGSAAAAVAQAAVAAAEDIVQNKRWSSAAIQGFGQQWQALVPEVRAQVREHPSLRALRSELDQNIQASSLAPDAPADELQRVEQMRELARLLDAGS